MRKENVYNSQNITALVSVFVIVFWLLYSLASFLHESRKIDHEIEQIRVQNEQNQAEIEEKKRTLDYLKTPQYIDKEAKTQMGKKQEGEQVLVFIEEQLEILPTKTEQRRRDHVLREDVPIWEKWKWVFWGKQ